MLKSCLRAATRVCQLQYAAHQCTGVAAHSDKKLADVFYVNNPPLPDDVLDCPSSLVSKRKESPD